MPKTKDADSKISSDTVAAPSTQKKMSRNKRIGLLWLLGPTGGVIVITLLYAIVTFMSSIVIGTSGESPILDTILYFSNFILGLAGTVCVLAIFVGVPVGLIYLTKKDINESNEGDTNLLPLAGIANAIYIISTVLIVFYIGLLIFTTLIYQGIIIPNDFLSQSLAYITEPKVSGTIYIAFFILFLRWLYSAYKNLSLLGHDTETTPGWAVGSFFIPIAQLWRPYNVVKELYLKTTAGQTNGIVILWWLTSIASLFIQDPIFLLAGLIFFVSTTIIIVSTVTRVQMSSLNKPLFTKEQIDSIKSRSVIHTIIIVILIFLLTWIASSAKSTNDLRIATTKANWIEADTLFNSLDDKWESNEYIHQLSILNGEMISGDEYITRLDNLSSAFLVAANTKKERVALTEAKIAALLNDQLSPNDRQTLLNEQSLIKAIKTNYITIAKLATSNKKLVAFIKRVGIDKLQSQDFTPAQLSELNEIDASITQDTRAANLAVTELNQAIDQFNITRQ